MALTRTCTSDRRTDALKSVSTSTPPNAAACPANSHGGTWASNSAAAAGSGGKEAWRAREQAE
jgi:hypothetical protein